VIVLVVLFMLFVFVTVKAKPLSAVANEEYAGYGNDIKRLASKYGVPASRVAAIIIIESNLSTEAVGTSGERGLMQLKQGAVSDVNDEYGTSFTWSDMFNPLKNIEAGTAYLAIQYRRCGSINDATQAYNAGFSAFRSDNSKGRDYLSRVLSTETTLQMLY